MAIKKIKVSGTSYDINDPRIAGVDNEPIENSENVITSGAVYTALESAGGGGTGTVTGAKVGTSGELIEPVEGVITLPAYPTTLPASDVSSWAKASTKPSYDYSEITNTPTIPTVPTNVSDFTNDAGYTTNTGTVTGIKVGESGNELSPNNGVVTIPEYPTSLPASDVSAWAKANSKPTYSYSEITDTPTIPTAVSQLTNDSGFTTNTGTVTGVQVGSGSTISPTDGVVTIPAYPTSLPASDVYDWAKASSKPSYSYSEISNTPSLGTAAAKDVPSTGNASTTQVVMGDDTRLTDARTPLSHTHTPSEVGLSNVTNDAQVKRTEMGAASGVATLGTDGKVPSSQLPSYVDDVLEYADQSSFPSTGESGKIYVALDTNKTYRWSGTAYVEISPSVVIGTTTGTAYDGASGAALASKLSGIEAGAQAHKAPTETEVKTALGTGSGTTKYLREDGTWATPPDTDTWRPVSDAVDSTSSSTAASSAAVKAAYDLAASKTSNVGTITSVGNTSSGAVTVSSSNNSASWGSAVTVGSVGGVDLKFTMPGNPNTDTNTWRPVQCDSTSIGDNTLNIVAGSNVTLSRDGGKITISSTDTNTWPSYTSQLTNNSGFITSSDIPSSLPASDVYSWAKQSTKPSYSYSEISGTPTIPTATSQLTNDSGYITSYTDTKTTTGSTDTSSKIYLVGTTSQTTYDTTYSDNEVYATNGVLTTKSVQVGGTAATMQYNPTLQAIEFVFA